MLANVDALYKLGGSATRPAPLWKEDREHGDDSKPQDIGPGGNDTDGADDGGVRLLRVLMARATRTTRPSTRPRTRRPRTTVGATATEAARATRATRTTRPPAQVVSEPF